MEQIAVYNSKPVEGLDELIATIDCELEDDQQFLIVVLNEEIDQDDKLDAAVLSAVASGAKVVVIWPLNGPELELPDVLRKLRHAIIKFDGQALHDVICGKRVKHEDRAGGVYPSPSTDRHCC